MPFSEDWRRAHGISHDVILLRLLLVILLSKQALLEPFQSGSVYTSDVSETRQTLELVEAENGLEKLVKN